MIIDSHQHVLWHGRNDADLVADMDAHGIDRAWLLTWEIPPGAETPGQYQGALNPALPLRPDGSHVGIPLSELVKTRERYPNRFVLGYCPYPLAGDAPALFEAAYHMHRVRVCGEWKFRVLFDDPRCLNLFRKAGELACPVVLHLDIPYLADGSGKRVYQPLWYGGTVDNLERALQACPETTFIGHAPGFWRYLSGDAESDTSLYPTGPVKPGGRVFDLLDRYPNLYADLSAGSALRAIMRDKDRNHGRDFLLKYQDRLLFARDYYGGQLLDFLRSLDLPREALDKILFRNAERLVKPFDFKTVTAKTIQLA